MPDNRKLRVFLCHASQDKSIVRELYQRLLAEGWIDPWLDEENLLPGQDWDSEIKGAVEDTDAVIVFLSNNSVSKEGYIQKEIKKVLDIEQEKPEGVIFLIPIRLDDCEIPNRLGGWHYEDYFPAERRDRAYLRLTASLKEISKKPSIAPNIGDGTPSTSERHKTDLQKKVNEQGQKVSEKVFPPYDRNKYEVWKIPRLDLLHWVLNPGLAFNELLLGQRIPKVTLIDKTLDKPLMERTFIPCPTCGELNDGRLWSKKNASRHWFGYVCPACDSIIPCLWNLTSLLILFIAVPFWYFFSDGWKEKWLEFEKKRLREAAQALELESQISVRKEVSGVQIGLGFGGTMWWILIVFPQLYQLIIGNGFDWRFLLLMIPVAVIGGLLFGFIMKLLMEQKPK